MSVIHLLMYSPLSQNNSMPINKLDNRRNAEIIIKTLPKLTQEEIGNLKRHIISILNW